MAAVVLAFQAPKPQPQRPWQNYELAELYRAVDILGRAGLAITADMGISDEGDPWFAFCRSDTGDVIVHCARISGVFVASSIAVSQTFRGGNFREVIDSIVRYSPLGIPVTTTNSQLFLHPLMVLAAFVATALLCSKNADAHDLHAAVVSLTPSESTASHKGFAALKAAIGQFLDTGSHVDTDARKFYDGTATNAEPIPLAAFMAAALAIVKPSFDAATQTLGVTDNIALTVADQTHMDSQPIARSVLLNANQDVTAVQPEALTSATVATTAIAAAWAKFGDLKLTFQTVLLSDHTTLPSADAGMLSPKMAFASGGNAFSAPQFDHVVLHHVQGQSGTVIAAPVIPMAPAGANADQGAATTPTASPDLIQQVAADFGIVTPVALSVLLESQATKFQAKDALSLLLHSPSHADSPSELAVSPPVIPSGSPAVVPNDPDTQPGTGQVASVQSGADVNSMVAQAVATLSPAAAAPPTIVLAADPMKGLAQLADYAASNHPITGLLVPAEDLQAGIATYTSQIAHSATLVVFDSDSVKLPFFEFIKGIIFVDDHELGINPSSAALANAVSVDLGSGAADGSMKLLGVIDLSQLHVVST